MRSIVNGLFLAAGLACVLYYLLCGFSVRFSQSMLWIWPVLGAALLLRYALAARGVALPRWATGTLRIVCVTGLIAFVLVECLIWKGSAFNCPKNVDYLIVLGAKTGSVTLERRIDRAAEYLLDNPQTVAIATGGRGTDEEESEASAIRRGLIARGVSDDRIRMEEKSTSTRENMRFARELMDEEGADVALVSNDYHQFRASRLAREVFTGNVYACPMRSAYLTLPHYMVREFFAVVSELMRGNIRLF